MNSSRITKLMSLYTRGLISPSETANGLLVHLIEDNSFDTELPLLLGRFDDEVKLRLQDLLRDIQRAGYRWKRFTIGPGGGSVLQSESDDSQRLRVLCAILTIV